MSLDNYELFITEEDHKKEMTNHCITCMWVGFAMGMALTTLLIAGLFLFLGAEFYLL